LQGERKKRSPSFDVAETYNQEKHNYGEFDQDDDAIDAGALGGLQLIPPASTMHSY
jgi:hypothetical protein